VRKIAAQQHVHLFGMPWCVTGYTSEATLPIMQVELYTMDHEEPVRYSLAAGSYLSFFTGHLIERSRIHTVASVDVGAIATMLETEPTGRLVFEITDTVIGYATVTVHGWHSPRFFRELASGLETNPRQIIEKFRDDPFVSLVIARLQRDVCDIAALQPFADRAVLFRKAARHLRDEMRTLIPRGGRNDKPVALSGSISPRWRAGSAVISSYRPAILRAAARPPRRFSNSPIVCAGSWSRKAGRSAQVRRTSANEGSFSWF
jgi:hypothetical protein